MTPIQRTTLSTLFFASISAIAVGTVAVPNIFGILKVSRQIEEEYARVGEISRQASSYQENLRNLKHIQEAVSHLELAYDETGELELVQTLEEFAKAANTPLTLQLKEGKKKDNAREVPLEIRLRGSYPSFLQFLVKIYGLPYVLKIESITLRTAPEDAARPGDTLEATMSGMVRFVEPI